MLNKGLVFMGMGFELLGLVLGGYYLGQAIDNEFGWPGYGVAALVICGLIGWMIHLIFLLKRFMAETADDTTHTPDH